MHLTEAETMIMNIIWASPNEPMELPVILEKVNSKWNKTWKPQTVSTFLNRLVKKDFLIMWREGRKFFYKPLIRLEEYQLEHMKHEVTVCFDGNIDRAMKCLEIIKNVF